MIASTLDGRSGIGSSWPPRARAPPPHSPPLGPRGPPPVNRDDGVPPRWKIGERLLVAAEREPDALHIPHLRERIEIILETDARRDRTRGPGRAGAGRG